MQDAHSTPSAIDAALLPDDLGACHALILQQARVLLAAEAARDENRRKIDELEAYLRKLLEQLYGRRSEKRSCDPNQRELDFGDDPAAQDALAEAAVEAEKIIQEYTVRREITKKTKEPRSEKFPAHFPRVEETIEPAAEDKTCAAHGEKVLIDYDITETLEFERPKLWVRVRKFAKYVCPQAPSCGVTQAERPQGLVEGNRFAPSLAAEVVANKYAYHIPLYREQDLFASSGWTPSRSTLLNILVAVTFAVRPLAEYMRKRALDSGGVGCDDTTVTLIVPPVAPQVDPNNPRSQRIHDVLRAAIDKGEPSVMARMWAYRSFNLPINVFDFTVSRHRDGPQEILADFQGTLMADCYSGFEAVVLGSSERIARAAC